MTHPSKWTVLGRAIRRWWKNEPPPPPSLPDMSLVVEARNSLAEYDDLYSRRTKNPISGYSAQAAQAVKEAGLKRSPSVEAEVRVLALLAERIITHIEEDIRRQHEHERPEFSMQGVREDAP